MTETAKDPLLFPFLRNLQFSPIKTEDEQYVLLWDPTGLSSEKLIVPLSYFYLLQFFDGDHSLEQIGARYLNKFGEFLTPDRLRRLVADLEAKMFLEGKQVESAKQLAQTAYRNSPLRKQMYAGKSYEGDAEKLKVQLEGFFTSKEGPPIKSSENKGKRIKGIVVPHYVLREAGPVYAWAYKELQEAEAPDVFIILGTCHSSLANLFAVTDKDFETPLGIVRADKDVLARFKQRGGTPFFQEDVRHQNEHTVEYQLPFLQHTVGRLKPITIVPVLCSFQPGCLADPQLAHMRELVETFLGALKSSLAESGKESCVVASAELAHIGMRYGDSSPPTDFSFHRCMQSDLAMLKHVEELDADAFAQFILKEDDSRRVFGFASIYTLLRLIEAEKGQVLRYDRGITDQFNSTVTFTSMAFF